MFFLYVMKSKFTGSKNNTPNNRPRHYRSLYFTYLALRPSRIKPGGIHEAILLREIASWRSSIYQGRIPKCPLSLIFSFSYPLNKMYCSIFPLSSSLDYNYMSSCGNWYGYISFCLAMFVLGIV